MLLQISFRDFPPSDAVKAYIRERAELLERFYPRVTSCRVVVEAHHRHHRHGRLFHARLDVTAPGTELVVRRDPSAHHAHEDVYVTLRDAFDAAQRQLEDYARRQRGDQKIHGAPSHGTVIRVLPERNCGFIQGSDGREIYFHRNAVLDGHFETLTEGSSVRYVVQEGESEQGPQASTVAVMGKHHFPGLEAAPA